MKIINTRTVPLQTLVRDRDIYPRTDPDPVHVAHLADAIRQGAKLPKLIAEAGTLRLVDGWHRWAAIRRVDGEDATHPVEFRSYDDEKELVKEAIALNAAHGKPLSTLDRVRAIQIAEKVGLREDQIVVALQVPRQTIEKLKLRIVEVEHPSEVKNAERTTVLKRSTIHLMGRVLTPEQAKANEAMPGTDLRLTALQLAQALRVELVDPTDEHMHLLLKSLRSELNAWLSRHPDVTGDGD